MILIPVVSFAAFNTPFIYNTTAAPGNFLGTYFTATSPTEQSTFAGNVGIASTSPNAPLSIMAGGNYGSQALSSVLQVGSTTNGTATTTLLNLWSNGELDIGKSGTGSIFTLISPILSGINTTNYQGTGNIWLNGTNLGIDFAPVGTFAPGILYRNSASGGLAAGNLEFVPATAITSVGRMFYSTSGNLGLGSTSPLAKLTIQLNTGDTNLSDIPFMIASSTATATSTPFEVSQRGHVFATSTAGLSPTVSSGNVTGSDWEGRVAGCTSVCTITFKIPYTAVPACLVQAESGSVTNTLSYTPSAASLAVTETSLGTFDYVCYGP